jgi:outer membrane receptor protein involved in Fe transport
VEKVAPSSFSQNRSVSFGALLTALLILPVSPLPAQQFGGIRGQVVDSDFGQPIAKASVVMMDTPFGAMTDEQGNFSISGVPPGAYTLNVRSSGYLPKLIPGVAVAAGEFNDLRLETIAEVEELEELVVPGELDKTSEVGLLAERQDATAVMDIMGADLISRLGAATAGDALKSMVGTSVVDGKYVVVRGLSDRYVNTLLNGGRLPSTDPDKRAINVDLFPGPTLESLNTTKTFTPDQPGDFTGGSVDIRTKTFPEKPSFGAGVRVEYNSQATFNPNFLTYPGGGTGPFGFQANKREIPSAVINAPILSTLAAQNPATLDISLPGDTDKAEEINRLQRQLTPVVGLTNKSVGPNTSVNLQGGDSIQLGEEEIFGLFGAFSQRNDYSTLGDASRVPSFKVENIGGNNVLVPQAETAENRGTQDNLWGTLVNMAYQPAAEQKVAVNFLFNQQASDVADSQQDTTTVPGTIGQYQVINYSQRTLAFLQFNGNHVVAPLGALQVDWVGGVGQSTLSEPDQRIFMNQFTPGTGVYQILGQQNYSPSGTTEPLQRYQRGLTEGNYNFLANLGLPFFPEDKGNPSKFKTGFYIDTSQRQYNQNYFAYNYGDAGNGTYETFGGPTDPSDGNNWSQVFLNENRSGLVNEAGQLGNDQPMSWTIGNFSGNAGNFYNAYQQVLASYTMVEFQLFPQLTLVGGARYENTDLQIRGANNLPNTLFPNPNFSGGGTGLAKIQQLDLLPAVGATFQLMENVNLRFAWSQTLARPSFKEMGPVVTQDFADSAIFLGNPQLQLSFINNYDFRAEYFPRAGEVVAFSLFYKLIDQPIEQTRVAIGTEGTEFFRYINNPSGSLYGAEFEVRKRLDQVASWLKNFSINFNYTYTQSQVQLTPGQIDANQSVGILETSRPLQGQPQYICNAGLSFDDQERGFYAGLFYNVTGQFLYAAGLEVPDIYEQPAPSLDFNLTQRFADQWSFTFRGKNLLNPVFKQTQTYQGTVYDYFQYTKGWDLSLAVNYSF